MEDIKKQIKLQYKVSFSNISKSLFIILGVCLLIMLALSVVFENSNETRFRLINMFIFIINVSVLIPLIMISHKEIIKLTIFLGLTRKKYFIANIVYTFCLSVIVSILQICTLIMLILVFGNVYNFTPIKIIGLFFTVCAIFVIFQMMINLLMLISYKFGTIIWIIFAVGCFAGGKYGIPNLINEFNILNNCFVSTLMLIIVACGVGILNWMCIRKLDIAL